MTLNWKAQVVLAVLGAGVIGGWFALNNAHQRELGAERILRQTADSISKVAITQSKTALALAERTAKDAVALRERARLEAARDQVVMARADSATRTAARERDAARQLLEDSLATVAQLRSQVGRLVASGVADSVAHAEERAQAARTKASLLAALAGDTLALEAAQGAIARAIARAEAAEKRVKLGKAARGRLLDRCGAIAGYGGVFSGSSFKAGPAVTLGCRVFP